MSCCAECMASKGVAGSGSGCGRDIATGERQAYNCALLMPRVLIDGVVIEARRIMLAPLDVARVLRVGETDVRNMIRRGELRDVSSDGRRRLDPEEVIALVEQRVRDGELGKHVFVELAALISGRL